jgi:osmotically inducible lipoprotein OsmB
MCKTHPPRLAAALALAAALVGLAACGSDPLTRGVTGGAMGAGVGAGAAALTGGKPATGALIGAGVGAAGGALTAH